MSSTATEPILQQDYLDEALNYRRLGGFRPELLDYLHRCGATPEQAEYMADRFDLELGMAGHPRPLDINPKVARQLDAHQELMAESQAAAAPVTPVAPVTPEAPAAQADPVSSEPAAAIRSASAIAQQAAKRHATGQADFGIQPVTTSVGSAISTVADVERASNPGIAPQALAPAAEPMPFTATDVPLLASPKNPGEAGAFAAPIDETPMESGDSPLSRSTSLAEAIASRNGDDRPAAKASAKAQVADPSATAGEVTEADWQETTEFGYRIAQSWDEDDPNLAINEAASMARAGKTQEEIVDHLMACQVSNGEAKYVAAMTGARSVPKPVPGAATTSSGKRTGRAKALIALMFLVGALLAYMGYDAWNEGVESARSPLSLAAVGGAFMLNGVRALISRR